MNAARARRRAAVAALLLLGAGRVRAGDEPGRAGGTLEARLGFGRHGLVLGASAQGRSGVVTLGLAGELEVFPGVPDPGAQPYDASQSATANLRLRGIASLGLAFEEPLGVRYVLAGAARPTRLRFEVAGEAGIEAAYASVDDPAVPGEVRLDLYRIPFAGARVGTGIAVGGAAALISAYARRELGPQRCVPTGDRCAAIFATVGGVVLSLAIDFGR